MLNAFLFFSPRSWLEKNTPHYYSECARVVGPLIERGCERIKTAAVFTSEKGTQLILWVREKSPQAIEWVSEGARDAATALITSETCLTGVCLCSGLCQYPRQCVPAAGLPEGAAAAPPPELHPACPGVPLRPLTQSLDQPPGLLQVSTQVLLSSTTSVRAGVAELLLLLWLPI